MSAYIIEDVLKISEGVKSKGIDFSECTSPPWYTPTHEHTRFLTSSNYSLRGW